MDTAVVRTLSFLQSLSDDEVTRALARSREVAFRDGETILEEGVRPVGLYVIKEGGARVLKAAGGRIGHKLAHLRRGDCFGEMSLVTDLPTTATVSAEGDVVCVHLPREAFTALLRDEPAIAQTILLNMVRTLARRLDRTDRTLARALRSQERWAALAHLAALVWLQLRIVLSYAGVLVRIHLLRRTVSRESMSRVHRRNARRFKETAARLKGANVKIGQIASMQAHLLPPEYIEELRTLRDAVGATEFSLIAGVIQSELGLGPFELFAELDRAPIAAASMAQVHVARLRTGEKVVVKVLHPGLEQSVSIDLALLRFIFGFLGLFFRKLDLRQIVLEADEPLRRELDLKLEADATEALGAELRPLGVVIPKVHRQLSSRRVLTLEHIDGVTVDRLEQIREWNVDRRALMEAYARAFFHQAFVGGLFHADPHPGNVLCTRDGRIALLDFGMVKRLPDQVRNGLVKELFGCFFNQPKLYADGLIEKGAIGEADRARVEAFAAKTFVDPQMRALLFDHQVGADGQTQAVLGTLIEMIEGLETFQTPRDNVMFFRALTIVIDVCKEVVPEVPMSELVLPILMPILGEFLGKYPEYAGLIAAAAEAAPVAAPPVAEPVVEARELALS